MRSDRLQDRLQRKLEAATEERARNEAGRQDVEARARTLVSRNLWRTYLQDAGRQMRERAARDLRALGICVVFILLGLLAASLSPVLLLLWCVALVAWLGYTIGSVLDWVGRVTRALLTSKNGK